jgi:hypothetical protein
MPRIICDAISMTAVGMNKAQLLDFVNKGGNSVAQAERGVYAASPAAGFWAGLPNQRDGR